METIDLSNHNLERITRSLFSDKLHKKIEVLQLNYNKLQILENINIFKGSLTQLTAVHNKIRSIKNLRSFMNLTVLDLSYNNIIKLDGVETLINLKIIKLKNNKVSEISYLKHNTSLLSIDLSHNLISKLSDISELHNLKVLNLDNNKIYSLTGAVLPPSITNFLINCNNLTDLHEMRHLHGLSNLESLSILGNQCIQMDEFVFDYRPYILNWCPNLKQINDKGIEDLERLRGEWLFSQGKGRLLHPGGHLELVKYLQKTFPFDEDLREAQDRKLKLILLKERENLQQAVKVPFQKVKAALTIQKCWRKYLLKRSTHSEQNIRENENRKLKRALAALEIGLEKERQIMNSFNTLLQKVEGILEIMEESQRSVITPRMIDVSTQTESIAAYTPNSVNDLIISSTSMTIFTNSIIRFLSDLFETEEEEE